MVKRNNINRRQKYTYYIIIRVNRQWHLIELHSGEESARPHYLYFSSPYSALRQASLLCKRVYFSHENIEIPWVQLVKYDINFWKPYLKRARVLDREQMHAIVRDPLYTGSGLL